MARDDTSEKKTPTGSRNGRGRGNKRDELRRFETNVLSRWDDVLNYAKDGCSRTDLAKYCNISYEMFLDGLERYPDCAKSLNDVEQANVRTVKKALIKRATGYEYTEVKKYIKKTKDGDVPVTETVIKHMPPDITAIGMYLRNYDNMWRDKDSVTVEMAKKELALKEKKAEEF